MMNNCTNNFIKRVIGVTRTFKWTITTNGAAVPLVAEDLTLQLVPPRGEAVSLPFDVDDNVVSFTWQGDDQHIIGCYSLILWANYGEDNQRRVDIHNFVELIPWSDRQSGEYSDLVEETIELETADFGENIMVVDNLNSTSATDALSANMGRQLNVTKQDVIQDLAAIRSGAAAGAAVKEWAKNDPLITDDGTQVSASKLAFNGNLFEQWVPGIASSIGLKGIAGFLKLADISQWDSAYNDRMLPTVAAVKAKLQTVLTALGTIEAVIPSQASSTNKLTDKDYVDGAIATNTANFVGTFDTLAELQAVPNPTKNDYGFVIEQDAQGNEYYDRYKYTGTQWLYEYKVESTPFTTEQWAAIQSGITAALVSKLSALPTNAELNTALAGKQPVIDDLTTIRSGAAAGATAYQKPSGGIPASDMASAVQTSLGKADAAAPQATTYTKTEVDAALALKQTSSQIATINGSDITHGGNVTIVAAEGQTITIDAAPTKNSNNAVSSGGVFDALASAGVFPIISENITKNNGSRISKSYYIGYSGEQVVFNCSLLSGTDSGRWKLYGTSTDGSSLDINTTIVDLTSLGTPAKFTMPSNGYVWLFTETVVSAATTYGIEAELANSVIEQLKGTNEKVVALDSQVNATLTDVDITKVGGSGNRISQALFVGNAGKVANINVSLKSGADTGRWKLYGTSQDGSSADFNTTIVDYTAFDDAQEFTIPSNGYVWLFTENTLLTARTYNVVVSLMSSLENRVTALEEAHAKPLEGKVMVCFGDSLTEFKGTDQKRYSDWLEEITGATIINVGIGGTQIRQRATPSATPQNQLRCYAGLDMVSVVTAAMTQDFTIVEASANKLAEISADDNTAIIARLKLIDWSKVDYVTVMGGANDWRGNVGSTGDVDSTSISETCGAMNNIISQICSTYKNIKLYWLTTIIQYVDPDAFSTETSYNIGDLCVYSGAYYRFVNAHQGVWNVNDVEQVTRADCRIPALFSDNKILYGKNLREFCALLESVAVKNHIPVADLYNKLGWNSYNFANFFPSYDNTHPCTGFKWLAEKIAKFILSN